MKQSKQWLAIARRADKKLAGQLADLAEMKKLTTDRVLLNNLIFLEYRMKQVVKKRQAYTAKRLKDGQQKARNILNMKYGKAHQKKSLKTARNKCQRWSEKEMAFIMKSELSDHKIAKKLGRTFKSISAKRSKIYASGAADKYIRQ